jgi:hypothetical protein
VPKESFVAYALIPHPKYLPMRWETISASSNNEVYQLHHKDKKLLTFTVHPFSNTARVECEDEKRVFLIRKEGFLRNKTVLRNEYGIKIGELGSDKNKEQFIEVNKERFYYSIRNNPLAELIIYKESKDQPLLVCGLNVDQGNTFVHFKKEKGHHLSYSGLLMALCWYMFLPVAKENVAQFAV